MIDNPELRRNIWLELTPHRLAAMPAVLLLIFLCVFALAERNYTPVAWTALGLFGVITVIWGGRLSADSVLDEFRDKTWDMQRMSAIGPWMLTWGKLIGATIFAWYGGIICLVVFFLNGLVGQSHIPVLAVLLLAVGTALLSHGCGILSGILAARNVRRPRPFANSIFFVFVLLGFAGKLQNLFEHQLTDWYGLQFDRIWFISISVWLFAGWSIIGVYRLLCIEMQVRTTLIVWLGFCAFLTVYGAGFMVDQALVHSRLTIFIGAGFFVALTMTYLAVWLERRDAITISRLVLQWKSANLRRALQETPCWMGTAPMALCFALLLILLSDEPLAGAFYSSFVQRNTSLLWPLKLWLFAMRDIALLHFFSMSRSPGRAGWTTMVYLVVIYWLVPQLLSLTKVDLLIALFVPWSGAYPAWEVIGALVQAVVVGWLALHRWQVRTAEIAQRSATVI